MAARVRLGRRWMWLVGMAAAVAAATAPVQGQVSPAGDWAAALATARGLLSTEPLLPTAAHEAAALLEGLAAPTERQAEVDYLLGRARRALGDTAGAGAAFTKAVVAAPRIPLYRLWLADSLRSQRRTTLAITEYRAAYDEPTATAQERSSAAEALTDLGAAPEAEGLLPPATLRTVDGVVRYWPGDPGAAAVAAALRLARDRWRRVSGLAGPSGVEVLLFRGHDAYAAFHARRGAPRPAWSAAASAGGRISLWTADGGPDALVSLLSHEYTHLALRAACADWPPPAWLDEGLAALISGQQTDADQVVARAPVLLDLAALSVPGFGGYDAGTARLAYAQSRAMTTDLLQAAPRGLGRLVGALADGQPFEQAFRWAYGVALDEWFKLWCAVGSRG